MIIRQSEYFLVKVGLSNGNKDFISCLLLNSCRSFADGILTLQPRTPRAPDKPQPCRFLSILNISPNHPLWALRGPAHSAPGQNLSHYRSKGLGTRCVYTNHVIYYYYFGLFISKEIKIAKGRAHLVPQHE